MSVRRDEKKMKIEKAKQILERCANESARLLIKNANNGDRQMAAAGFRLATALSMASLAMERQIPKAPVHRTPTSYWDDEVYECPICQNLVGMDDLRINYCDTCGQALEWNFSEEEDE
nr:MAG TPA: RimK-related lysine biosynthesis protein, Probable-dependent amine/thiol ligase family Amino-group [Caudoviricetes sp.]